MSYAGCGNVPDEAGRYRGLTGARDDGVATVEEHIDFIRQHYVPHVLRRMKLDEFPNHLVVFDIETSGFKPQNSAVLQVGIVSTDKGRIVESEGFYVKCPEAVTEKSEEVNGISAVMLANQGIPPEVLFPLVGKLLHEYREKGCVFVGHNAIKFDVPFLEYYLRAHGSDFEFGADEVIDTGMWVKGVQLKERPTEADTLRSFSYRVGEIRARVKWALDRHCIPTYDLSFEAEKAHDATYDCLITLGLLQRLIGGTL